MRIIKKLSILHIIWNNFIDCTSNTIIKKTKVKKMYIILCNSFKVKLIIFIIVIIYFALL